MNALSLSNRDRRHPVANGRLPEMDHLLDRVFSGFDFTPPVASHRWPDVQVDENDREFRVTVDLPGVDTKDVELSFNDGTLTLKAKRKPPNRTRATAPGGAAASNARSTSARTSTQTASAPR